MDEIFNRLPKYVMLEMTELDSKFKVSLVDKKHEEELDCEIHEWRRDYSYLQNIIEAYKKKLSVWI